MISRIDTVVPLRGPQPGLLGDVAAMHGRYYAEHWSFPTAFECKVAAEMAVFLQRYDAARDVVLSVADADRFVASVTLDGSDPGLRPGEAHMRWLVVRSETQGRGLGKRLLGDALGFARKAGFTSVYLTTFRGLDAAAALYASVGFRVVDEREGKTWGRSVQEQRLELIL